MFAVLCIEEEKRRFGRAKEKIEVIQTPVRAGAPFRIIHVTPSKKGLNWQHIALKAGCGCRNMLFPTGFTVPESSFISPFVADTLPLLIMLNTAASMLQSNAAIGRRLLIEDKNGVLAEYTERIINCASKIKIVTDRPQKYYRPRLKLMESYGAAPLICQSIDESEVFDAAVALSPVKNSRLNFSTDLLGRFMPELPPEYSNLRPEGIDPLDFACALFECSAVQEIGRLRLDSIS